MARSTFSGPVASATGFAAFQENVDNVSLPLSSTGTGVVSLTTSVPYFLSAPVTVTTAAAVTYTPAQIKTGFIIRNTSGASRSDLFPTAAQLVAALPGAFVNMSFDVEIRNIAGAAETITMTTNTGLTLSGTMTIAQSNQRRFRIQLTNVTAGAEAATVYSMSAGAF